MGVKISEFFPRKTLKWEDLENKRIALDFSNMAYQFLSSIRQRDGTPLMDSTGNVTSIYSGLFYRLARLMSLGAKLCIIFDGEAPELKYKEQEKRRERKSEAIAKYKEAKDEEDIEAMGKYAKRTSRMTSEMIGESKELIKAMGLPLVQSPCESDGQMAHMCGIGDIWACATTDADPLLHGAPRLLINLTFSEKRKLPNGSFVYIYPHLVELKDVLKNLGLSQDQLIALGILTGTDYNPGGIYGIGPKKALKLVKEHKDMGKMFKELNADFDWEEIFKIFKGMPVEKKYRLEWNMPDEEAIKKILVDRHEFSLERVENTLKKFGQQKEKQKQSGLDKWC